MVCLTGLGTKRMGYKAVFRQAGQYLGLLGARMGRRILTLITTLVCLLSYFFKQMVKPRRLAHQNPAAPAGA